MRIILVDDERLIVEGLKKIIGRKYPEMEISAFTGPEDALNEMKARLPELLITDIRMPGMTGLELIAACRKQKVFACRMLCRPRGHPFRRPHEVSSPGNIVRVSSCPFLCRFGRVTE